MVYSQRLLHLLYVLHGDVVDVAQVDSVPVPLLHTHVTHWTGHKVIGAAIHRPVMIMNYMKSFFVEKMADSCWRVPPPTAGWRRAGWPSAPCSCPRPPSACHTRHSWRSLRVKFQRRKDGGALPPRSKCGNSGRWEPSLFQPSQTSWSSGTSWVSSPSWRGGEPKGTS